MSFHKLDKRRPRHVVCFSCSIDEHEVHKNKHLLRGLPQSKKRTQNSKNPRNVASLRFVMRGSKRVEQALAFARNYQ